MATNNNSNTLQFSFFQVIDIYNFQDTDNLFAFQFRPEMLDTLYTFAKFQYECGNYSGAADYLYLHRGLVPVSDKVRQQFS